MCVHLFLKSMFWRFNVFFYDWFEISLQIYRDPVTGIIPFEINGLYTVPFTVTGEGGVPRIELVNPSQKSLSLGALRVGETTKRTVKVVCKSKVWPSVA